MEARIAGGIHDVEDNDPGVQDAAEFAIQELGKQSNSLEPMTLVEIVNVKRQVVAGLNYFLKLKVRAGQKTMLYDVTVYKHFSGSMQLLDAASVDESKHVDG